MQEYIVVIKENHGLMMQDKCHINVVIQVLEDMVHFGKNLNDGSLCVYNDQCKSGRCSHNGIAGEYNGCCGDYYPNSSGTACIKKLDRGQSCRSDKVCKSGNCNCSCSCSTVDCLNPFSDCYGTACCAVGCQINCGVNGCSGKM